MANHTGTATGRAQRILGDLAEALGFSIDVFFGGGARQDIASTEELLRLCFSIEDVRARQRILDCARAVSAEAQS
ncbi:hypothetical protein ACRBEV_29120 [Methylobacterium phyllosphaerae]